MMITITITIPLLLVVLLSYCSNAAVVGLSSPPLSSSSAFSWLLTRAVVEEDGRQQRGRTVVSAAAAAVSPSLSSFVLPAAAVASSRTNCRLASPPSSSLSSSHFSRATCLSSTTRSNDEDTDTDTPPPTPSPPNPRHGFTSAFTVNTLFAIVTHGTPVWTVMIALYTVHNIPTNARRCAQLCGPIAVLHTAYAVLMFVMGFALPHKNNNNNNDDQNTNAAADPDANKNTTAMTTPTTTITTETTVNYPILLTLNAVLCFGMMPTVAYLLSTVLYAASPQHPSIHRGLLVLGSVSGGQASNLFTLLAGGDVPLSIACTVSTTLLGVLVTPVVLHTVLRQSIALPGGTVLRTIVTLVVVPLLCGTGLARVFPRTIQSLTAASSAAAASSSSSASNQDNNTNTILPVIGVVATLVLVAGGASNTIVTMAQNGMLTLQQWPLFVLPSCLLSCIGGGIAYWITNQVPVVRGTVGRPQQKTLVIETISKSPTLAYLLAVQHFDDTTSCRLPTTAMMPSSTIPGAAMVTLAVLGACVASVWSLVTPRHTAEEETTATVGTNI